MIEAVVAFCFSGQIIIFDAMQITPAFLRLKVTPNGNDSDFDWLADITGTKGYMLCTFHMRWYKYTKMYVVMFHKYARLVVWLAGLIIITVSWYPT